MNKYKAILALSVLMLAVELSGFPVSARRAAVMIISATIAVVAFWAIRKMKKDPRVSVDSDEVKTDVFVDNRFSNKSDQESERSEEEDRKESSDFDNPKGISFEPEPGDDTNKTEEVENEGENDKEVK